MTQKSTYLQICILECFDLVSETNHADALSPFELAQNTLDNNPIEC